MVCSTMLHRKQNNIFIFFSISNMAYAFIDEVWGTPMKSSSKVSKSKIKQDPSCSLYKRKDGKERPLDDIMNAYMDEAPYDKYERTATDMQQMRKRERSLKAVEINPSQNSYDASEKYVQVEDEDRGVKPVSQSKRCFDADNILGIKAPLTSFEYDYDKYYSDNIIQDEQTYEEHDESCIDDSKLEQNGKDQISKQSFNRDEIFNDVILEKYVNALQSKTEMASNPQKMYLDLALYVGSGILIIFMMEQILQLGMMLR